MNLLNFVAYYPDKAGIKLNLKDLAINRALFVHSVKERSMTGRNIKNARNVGNAGNDKVYGQMQ
jgi:hypothetical protein